MHGNVWEWVQDQYDQNYYKNSPSSDPKGPSAGSLRVLRGGGWIYYARYCRAADLVRLTPDYRDDYLGFRLIRTL
jgi:formylglycine-generating enzyme required for sulfatase activity